KLENEKIHFPEKRKIDSLEECEFSNGDSVFSKKSFESNKSMDSSSKMQNFGIFIGAHVSAAKGIYNAAVNSASIGYFHDCFCEMLIENKSGNAFAMFLKSQRKWVASELKVQDIDYFKKLSEEYGYDLKKYRMFIFILKNLCYVRHVLPHGSYLVNLANSDKEKRDKAYVNFIDDVKRCQKLGIGKFNFHPGSCGNSIRADGIKHLTDCINRAHKEVSDVVLVVENMQAGQGNTLGNSFEELATILDKVEDKSRIGFCLDTCHLFASGYDIRTKESYHNVMDKFENIIGFKYLA
ncbi:unnamed protein product, partial [Pneumocystis jirovecii]